VVLRTERPAHPNEPPPASTEQPVERKWDWYLIVATVALVLQSGLLFLALFEPSLPYSMVNRQTDPLDSERFLLTLAATTHAHSGEVAALEVLTDGRDYYPAELAAIRAATMSITMEGYIIEDGEVQAQFFEALSERARAGVKVHLVADAVGSIKLSNGEVAKLQNAGGRFAWYMPLRWYTWHRINYRAHRELLIVDGRIGFIGGSGWADHWIKPTGGDARAWRDTMVRVEGPIVTHLQSAFSENWLEASGEVLNGKEFFPFESSSVKSKAMVVRSSPSYGRGTSVRVLFQSLMAAAQKRIHITTPYFLPDNSVRDELIRAIKERGVEVKIITPGPGTDHLLTRRSSRRLFGPLLEAGAQIYEYDPAMIHAKVLLVDDLWSVVGSTNIDPRSFQLNDEVNLAMPDTGLAARLEADFREDLAHAKPVDYEEWRKRGVAERIHEFLGMWLQRQQ